MQYVSPRSQTGKETPGSLMEYDRTFWHTGSGPRHRTAYIGYISYGKSVKQKLQSELPQRQLRDTVRLPIELWPVKSVDSELTRKDFGAGGKVPPMGKPSHDDSSLPDFNEAAHALPPFLKHLCSTE